MYLVVCAMSMPCDVDVQWSFGPDRGYVYCNVYSGKMSPTRSLRGQL